MKKRNPTAPYIMDLTSASEQYLQSVYKGLLDVPLDQLYPFMNFDEVLQVSDGHRRWRVRDRLQGTDSFGSFVRSHTIPHTLGHLVNRGWSSFDYLHGQVAQRNKPLHDALHPFGGTIEHRVQMLNDDVAASMRYAFLCTPSKWYFETTYHAAKKRRVVEHPAGIMPHMPAVKPKTEAKRAQAFANAIRDIIKTYPTQVREPPQPPQQLGLF